MVPMVPVIIGIASQECTPNWAVRMTCPPTTLATRDGSDCWTWWIRWAPTGGTAGRMGGTCDLTEAMTSDAESAVGVCAPWLASGRGSGFLWVVEAVDALDVHFLGGSVRS